MDIKDDSQNTAESSAMGIAFNSLLRSLINALKWEFAAYMPMIMAPALRVLAQDNSEDKNFTKQVVLRIAPPRH